jgi:TPR repeat protein
VTGGRTCTTAVHANVATLLIVSALLAPAVRAAEGLPADRVALATAYEHGEGVPKDPLRAVALYCEAARDGDPTAQFALGWMYANGRGIPRDDDAASSLFALASDQDHEHAGWALERIGGARDKLPECMRPRAGMMPPAEAPEQLYADPFPTLPPRKREFADLVRRLAADYDVSPRLALAIVAVESNFEPAAKSPKDARGLMQLIPGTAARFNVKNAFDPADNVRGGLAYLRWLLAYYRGNVTLAAAAYNAGERAVDRYGGVPPYQETRNYVQRVLGIFGRSDHPFDPDVAEPSPAVSLD